MANPSLTVLVLQPSAEEQSMYAYYLKANGYHVVSPRDATQALAAVADVDVVVTDIDIAGQFDGVELIRRIRDGASTRSKVVVVVTAHTSARVRDAAASAGYDLYLMKPVTPEDLAVAITRACADRMK